MIYTFFMKKFQKDKAPFPTTMVVKKYLYLYGQNDIVISFPGIWVMIQILLMIL